jgi:hypothetical protein
MGMIRVISRWIILVRAQRRNREILLAIALTLAAVAFITAAMSSTDPHAQIRHVQSGTVQSNIVQGGAVQSGTVQGTPVKGGD